VVVQFSHACRNDTLTPENVQLFGPNGKRVPGTVNPDAPGELAVFTPSQPLQPQTRYTLKVSDRVRDAHGRALLPFESSFTTGNGDKAGPVFRFEAIKLEDRDSVSTLAVGPDRHLYVADTNGLIVRYQLDPKTGLVAKREEVVNMPADQIVGLCFDPQASAEHLVLWMTHARQTKQAGFTGKLSRLVLPAAGQSGKPQREDIIVGLPHPKKLLHQTNGLAFGPDGRLYIAQGGNTSLGHPNPGDQDFNSPETPLSASVLAADVRSSRFPRGIDVTTPSYDPFKPGAPVQLYATGCRNVYDLVWHSSGRLYGPNNGNGRADQFAPPGPNNQPPMVKLGVQNDHLYRIEKGGYYGHPNPSIGKYVLNGGNPTSKADPYEIGSYPVGTRPEPDWRPPVYDLGRNRSANGIAEYAGPGALPELRGYLLLAEFSGGDDIRALGVAPDGKITDDGPLCDSYGRPLRFNNPLDVAVDGPSGRIYLAAFGTWAGSNTNQGKGGAVWLLRPLGAKP
jgi:glucose/arabinose dehydrogenase